MKFEALDTLRGVAAISVAIFHFLDGWAGYLAVDFFLVLSGFVLSHSYLYKDSPVSVRTFISHRIARLYPLHIFTLITFILVHLYINNRLPSYPDGTLFTFLQNLTLTQNIGFNPNGLTFNSPSWTISVEFWINILFILYVTKRTPSHVLFFISLVGFLIIHGNTGNLDVHSKNYLTFINSGIIRGTSSFFLGIISYRCYLIFKDDLKGSVKLTLLEIVGLAGVLFVIMARDGKYSGLDFFAPFVFSFVVVVYALERGFISGKLRIIKYFGEISYSLYLNQIIVLLLVRYSLGSYGLSTVSMLSIYLLVLVVTSHFTYQYVEKPSRIRGRNLLERVVKPD